MGTPDINTGSPRDIHWPPILTRENARLKGPPDEGCFESVTPDQPGLEGSKEARQVPSFHPARYFFWSSLKESISIPMEASFNAATLASIVAGTG